MSGRLLSEDHWYTYVNLFKRIFFAEMDFEYHSSGSNGIGYQTTLPGYKAIYQKCIEYQQTLPSLPDEVSVARFKFWLLSFSATKASSSFDIFTLFCIFIATRKCSFLIHL